MAITFISMSARTGYAASSTAHAAFDAKEPAADKHPAPKLLHDRHQKAPPSMPMGAAKRRGPGSNRTRRVVLAWLIAASAPAAAQTDNFDQRCERLAQAATITVSFEDTPVTWDTRRSADELSKLGPPQANPYHTVLGLTHAKPTANIHVAHRSLTHPEGRVCIVGDIRLTLTFTELKVYLAKELTDPCRRQIVEEHEAEHVRIYRHHFRAGARMAESLIRQTLILPIHAVDVDAAEAELRRRMNEIIAPLAARITSVAMAANQEIDTPSAYREIAARIRACP
jgi:hypothetical protein